MKIKRIPEDFQVVEQTDVRPTVGDFAFYRLRKRWVGTLEALDWIAAQWKTDRKAISYGGLKDFHGVTEQFLTIRRGPKRNLPGERTDVEYLGQVPQPFTAQDIAGNSFAVVLRELSPAEATALPEALACAARDGVPNYFDDQRFGSLGDSGEFIALPWCKGDYEKAVKLALADPNSHDSRAELEQKKLLQDNWGEWKRCKALLARSNRRSIITFLDDRPGDFRGAIACMRVDLRSLYASAFQSYVWNTMLATVLRKTCGPARLGVLKLRHGEVPALKGLIESERAELRNLELPLPSARLKLDPGPLSDLVEESCRACGLERREMRFKYPRDTFFSRGQRTALLRPSDQAVELADDDRNPGRRKAAVRFRLPRGAYATMVLKNLALAAADEIAADERAADPAEQVPADTGEPRP